MENTCYLGRGTRSFRAVPVPPLGHPSILSTHPHASINLLFLKAATRLGRDRCFLGLCLPLLWAPGGLHPTTSCSGSPSPWIALCLLLFIRLKPACISAGRGGGRMFSALSKASHPPWMNAQIDECMNMNAIKEMQAFKRVTYCARVGPEITLSFSKWGCRVLDVLFILTCFLLPTSSYLEQQTLVECSPTSSGLLPHAILAHIL